MYKNKDGVIEDTYQAFLVDGAYFTKIEEYPIIREDMVPNYPPTKIMPFHKAITYRGDLSEYVIYFYSQDRTFKRVLDNPRKYLPFFKKCKGIIGFDYSVHTDMPTIKQKSQLNNNLCLSFYYGNNGVPIYPNCRGGADHINEEYLKALPKHTYIALGVHGFIKLKEQQHEWRLWIDKIIKTLEPLGFVIVGHLPQKIIEDYKDVVKFYLYDSFIEERYKEVQNNAH